MIRNKHLLIDKSSIILKRDINFKIDKDDLQHAIQIPHHLDTNSLKPTAREDQGASGGAVNQQQAEGHVQESIDKVGYSLTHRAMERDSL